MMDWAESSSLQFLVLVCVGIVVSGHDATSQEKPFQACIPDHNYVKTKNFMSPLVPFRYIFNLWFLNFPSRETISHIIGSASP